MEPSKSEYAIQLIRVNEDGKYILTQQGAQFVSKVPAPIAIVSVAGMYRTGKSYLLNRMLLNRCNGFGVGPTVNPCTKGLWCWNRTISGKTNQGQNVNVLIIDTEGIGALDQDQTHDTRIFTLAILAASSFIYNSTGSIDQNALQNLSLVVNLTKSIQLNTLEEEQEDDPEELANYFPSFYWVVRDFALQLTTADGDPISPKQYLQRALAPQKGFSDDIEQKNRIRRLLSTFFKERECFTMVRPLVDQKKLQHLDKLELDELRPQFVEQAMNFRRRILNRIKPKLLKGKQLDGQMYLCLLNSYVSAINNGAVPNIQNAWNYMCQEQCAKAFQEALDTFNKEFTANIKSHLPIQEQYLLDYLNELKDKCCEQFQTKAIGEQVKFHQKQLGGKLQHKIQMIRSDNEKQSQTILKNYFKKNIIEIQNKLKLREYSKFEEFTKDINQFYHRILESGPNLPKKQLIYLELIKRVVPMAAQIFLKEKTQEFQKYRAISTQKQETLLKIQQCLKKELEEENQKNTDKINALDRQIIELKLSVDDYKNTKQKLCEEMAEKQEKYTKIIKNYEETNSKNNEKYTLKIEKLTENVSDLQNQLSLSKYEQQKKIAVLEMKIKQLETNLEQSRKKQTALELSLKSLKISLAQQNKEISEKFQYELKNKDLQISNISALLAESEETKTNQASQTAQKISKLEETITLLREQSIKKENNLKKQIEELQESYNTETIGQSQTLKQVQKNLEVYQTKYTLLQKELQKNSEEYIIKENRYKTDIAIMEQKMGFLKTQNEDYQLQVAKIKQMYQQLAEQEKTRKQQEQQMLETAKITQLTDTYETTIRELKNEHEIILKKLSSELETASKNYNQKMLENKLLKSSSQNMMAQKQQETQESQNKYKLLLEESKREIEDAKEQINSKQKFYVKKIDELTQQLQNIAEQRNRQRQQMVNRTELGVKELKNFYELEKQRAENKLIAEKEKYQRKLNMYREEFDQKMKDEVSQLEEENERMRNQIMEMQEEFNKELNNRKIQFDIKSKNLESLQKSYEDLRVKIEQKEADFVTRLQKQQKDSKTQKQSLYAKIEQLLTTQSKIEKQKINLTHSKENLEKIISQRDHELGQIKEELNTLRVKIEKERDEYKNMKNEINTKRNQERVELQKKVALLEQQNIYIKKKLQDNQKIYGSEQESNEEKIKKIKEQYAIELKSEKQKNIQQFQALEKKYDKLKRSSKENESALNKNISQLQKQLAISSERLSNLTQKLATFEQKSGQESEQYISQISSLKSSFYKQKQDLKEQLEKQQQEKERAESQKNSVQASYQQDKILWQNRIKFLEENKQKAKNQYESSKIQLEAIIDKNRKKHATQKLTMQTTHSEKIVKLQKKYWTQKQELSQNYKKQQSEYESKIKTLQFELRALQEKTAFDEQNKIGEINISEKKMKEMIENEKKLTSEVQRLRTLRERENKQQLQIFEKQKSDLRQKNMDKDEKLKASEKQRQHLFYQIQKERAKWGIERDTIVNKIEEQKEVIMKNERDIEKLQRQNEKLKVEKKCHKSSLNSMARYGGGFTYGEKTGSSRASFEDSVILKENSNNSQISDTSIFFKE